ncbi:peptidase M15 [bacterium]|nr:peptidase M15 [bacterium]
MINFSISELINSDTAQKNNINNMPDVNSLDNILNLIVCCLQPIRDLIKKPMIITSGFRSKKLNQLVGGATNSHHLIGCAADFIINGMKPNEIIKIVSSSDIKFNQLINEYDKWVHISYIKNNYKNQILTFN